MPSRFPWSKSSSSQAYNSDPALDIPRASSRQELTYAHRPSPLEGSYNPYNEAHHSNTSFDSTSPPPTASQPRPGAFSPSPEQAIAGQPYEQHSPYPAQASSQKAQPPKKSLRSKLLAATSSHKDEPESGKDSLFGRKKSIRRKEAPQADHIPTQHEEHVGPWPLDTEVGHPSNHSGTFEPFSPDFAPGQVDSRDYHSQAPPPPPHQQQPYLNYSPQQQSVLQARQAPYPTYRNPLAEESVRSGTPPARPSFDSIPPQPPSRPDSRPISSQSHERQLGSAQQVQGNPQDSYQVQAVQEPYQQQVQQNSPAELMVPPLNQRVRQNQPTDSAQLGAPNSTVSRDTPYPNSNPNSATVADPNMQNTQGLSNHPAASAGSQRGQQLAQESERPPRTPPPARSANEMSEAEINQLIRDHKEMKQKYNNVKRQYFDKRDQVDALQNTLAHQRLAQSRTHWDDGEYVTRMTRLDGLISQLAFGMRKDWKVIPDWLQPQCNKDALQLGKQEMTAVGRAFVSRWLAEELFDKYFHPGLAPDMSAHLKWIQINIRDYAPISQSAEEEEALTAKIINWRLATVDGLHPVLASQEAVSNRQALIQALNHQLVEDIKIHMLDDQPPAGLEGGVQMIIDLAVAILANLPLESRDIHVNYFTPGHPVNQDIMRIETGIPPLPDSGHATEGLEGDQGSMKSGTSGGDGHDVDAESGSNHEEHGKRGFLSGLVGGAKRSLSPHRVHGAKPESHGATSQGVQQQQQQQLGNSREDRVRMCLFLGVQNRGKMVLVKAPVFKA